MKNPNIKVNFKNGKVDSFTTESSNDFKMPNLCFNREEDAELAVAIAKAMKARGEDTYELNHVVKYVFRVLGFNDSGWTK